MTYVFPTYTPPPPYPVIATLAPCRDCGEPIQPGQSYVPGKCGPLHVYCGLAPYRPTMSGRPL